MRVYEFELVLAGVEVMTEDIAEALFAAGCDDGSPHSGNGVAAVGFDREAKSLEQAIASAVADVKQAGFDVARVELSGDEIALLRA